MAAVNVPASLEKNKQILDEKQWNAAMMLLRCGQEHVFADWPAAGTDDAQKKKMLDEIAKLDRLYAGGLETYVKNAKALLKASKEGTNPFEGYVPHVPHGERLSFQTPEFDEMEEKGLHELPHTAFVLVAGGLGERLGYQGIKIGLPAELATEHTFLQTYVDYLLEYQRQCRIRTGKKDLVLPLAIMTSGDTDTQTRALLKENHDFGTAPGQITIIKQELVPALTDNDAHFAMAGKYELSLKPHGHGDVHSLLHSSGLAKKWATTMGIKWIVFFQDTNGVVFRAVPSFLGVSASHQFEVNSLTVPRKPGEAVGGICLLKHKDGNAMTINVEYNQLEPLLKNTGDKKGDVPDETGYSLFPGNTNVLAFAAVPYAEMLDKTHGGVPEFVNPKYADEHKNKFKAPTRLECMMQDYPKLLGPAAKVGFTQLDRWLCFSAVKNNLTDAQAKVKSTGVPECASSGESDIYLLHRTVLKTAKGVELEVDGPKKSVAGIPLPTGASIVLAPNVGITRKQIVSKFGPGPIRISPRSVFVLDGADITVDSLELDGSLVIRAVPGAKVTIRGLKIVNKGWHMQEIDLKDKSIPQKYLIRGYVMNRSETATLVYDKPGDYVLNAVKL